MRRPRQKQEKFNKWNITILTLSELRTKLSIFFNSKVVLVLIAAFVGAFADAKLNMNQKPKVLHLRVIDKEDGEPIEGALIKVDPHNKTAISGEKGIFFYLDNIKTDTVYVSTSRWGYYPSTLALSTKSLDNKTVNIKLRKHTFK